MKKPFFDAGFIYFGRKVNSQRTIFHLKLTSVDVSVCDFSTSKLQVLVNKSVETLQPLMLDVSELLNIPKSMEVLS